MKISIGQKSKTRSDWFDEMQCTCVCLFVCIYLNRLLSLFAYFSAIFSRHNTTTVKHANWTTDFVLIKFRGIIIRLCVVCDVRAKYTSVFALHKKRTQPNTIFFWAVRLYLDHGTYTHRKRRHQIDWPTLTYTHSSHAKCLSVILSHSVFCFRFHLNSTTIIVEVVMR